MEKDLEQQLVSATGDLVKRIDRILKDFFRTSKLDTELKSQIVLSASGFALANVIDGLGLEIEDKVNVVDALMRAVEITYIDMKIKEDCAVFVTEKEPASKEQEND